MKKKRDAKSSLKHNSICHGKQILDKLQDAGGSCIHQQLKQPIAFPLQSAKYSLNFCKRANHCNMHVWYKNGGVLENTCCGITRQLLIVMR